MRVDGREVAELARRRRGVGQLRDRAGVRRVSTRRRGGRSGGAVAGAGYGAHVAGRRRARGALAPSAAADRCRRPDRAARRDLDDPALHFAGWEWVAFALATPVVFWCGCRFHRAALRSLRHRAATMDTLVSLGTLAAWSWSVVVLVAVDSADTYFEVAARRNDADPARPVPRDAGQAPFGRRVARARQAGRQGGTRPARRRGGGDSRRGARGRRPVRRAARREARRGRHRRGRRLRARPVDADRRAGSGGGRAGRQGGRRDDQHLGAARRARDARRRRDGGRADRAPRHGGPGGKAPVQRLADRISGVFVPVVVGALARDARRLARRHRATRARRSRPRSRC